MYRLCRGSSAAHAVRRLHVLPVALACALCAAGLGSPARSAAGEKGDPLPALRDDASRRSYDVPAGPLGLALTRFASQAGLLLSFDPALTRGLDAPALVGRYTVGGALRQLLAGTSLQVSMRADGSYALAAASGPPSEAVLLPSSLVVADGLAQTQVYTAPRSSVHLSGAELDRYGRGVSPADLLKGLPGVQVGDSRNGGALDVNIRGVQGQSRVAVRVDGSEQAMDVYRGYAGTQQRSYIDPDLISAVTIHKGPTMKSGAIGGTVEMQTLGVGDIVREGRRIGLRLKGDLWNNGLPVPPRDARVAGPLSGANLYAQPRRSRGSLFGSQAKSGSLALGYTDDRLDVVLAHAQRNQGNYVAGRQGWDSYRSFDRFGSEQSTVARIYKPGEEVLNSSNRNESLLLKATLRPAQGHELELGYRRYDGRNGEIMPSDIFRSRRAGIYQYPPSEVRVDTYTTRYDFRPAGNPLVDLRSRLWLTDASTSLLAAVVAPASQAYFTDRNWSRQANRRIGGELNNAARVSSGLGDFKLDLGGAFQFEDIRPQNGVTVTQHEINADQVVLRDATRREFSLNGKLDFQPIERLTLWTGGRYTQFRSKDRSVRATAVREDRRMRLITVGKPRQLGLMAWYPDANGEYTDATDPRLNNGFVSKDLQHPFDGVSYEEFGATTSWVEDERVHSMVTGYRYASNIRNRDSGFSPSFGISIEPLPDTLVYASYTVGLRMPSLFETSRGTLSIETDRALVPERSRSWEIGASTVRQRLLTERDRAGLKVAYFANDIKHYITRYFDPSPGLNGVMRFSNTDRYQTSGLELQSYYDAGPVFADLSMTYYLNTRTCDAAFAATLRATAGQYQPTQDTPDCTPGSFMGSYTNTQNPPKLALNLTAGLRLFNEALTVGGRLVYTSGPTARTEKPWQIGPTTPQRLYLPVTLVDLFMNVRVREHTELSLAVRNLTDRYYLDPLAQSLMPAPGRTVYLGMRTQF